MRGQGSLSEEEDPPEVGLKDGMGPAVLKSGCSRAGQGPRGGNGQTQLTNHSIFSQSQHGRPWTLVRGRRPPQAGSRQQKHGLGSTCPKAKGPGSNIRLSPQLGSGYVEKRWS